MRDPIQLLYWRIVWPGYASLSLSTAELEVWLGSVYWRLLWQSPETGRFALWSTVGRRGSAPKFNAAEAAKFAAVSQQ